MRLRATRLSASGANRAPQAAQPDLRPTLDLVFAGMPTDLLSTVAPVSFAADFVAQAYQSVAQYASGPTPPAEADFDLTADVLDPRISFSRASAATYFDSAGVLQTAAVNEWPVDYDPVTLQRRGRGVWEQRTNSIRNNTMQGATAGAPGVFPTNWSTSLSGSGVTQEIAAVGTENGIAYVDVRYFGTPSAGTSVAIGFEGPNQLAAASGQTWVESVFLKLQAGSFDNTSTTLSLLGTNGVNGTESITSSVITSTPSNLRESRISISGTFANALTTRAQPRIRIGYTVGVAFDITLRIGLPQLEQGAFATPPIPTSGTAATRAVDVALISGTNFTSWYNQSEGTLYGEVSSAAITVGGASRRIANLNDGTEANRITVGWAGVTAAGAAFVSNGGVTQAGFNSPSGAYPFPTKVALAYKAADFQAAVNGSAFARVSSGTVPTVNRMTIGDVVTGGTGPQNLNGHIRRIRYWPVRLSNVQLQAITA